MNVDDIRLLYDFNSWANHRTLEACAALTPEQFTRDLGIELPLRARHARAPLRRRVDLARTLAWPHADRRFRHRADFPDFETVRRRFVGNRPQPARLRRVA